MMWCGKVHNLWWKNLVISLSPPYYTLSTFYPYSILLIYNIKSGLSTIMLIVCKVNKFISFSVEKWWKSYG